MSQSNSPLPTPSPEPDAAGQLAHLPLKSSWRTRLFSLAALLLTAAAFIWLGATGYWAVVDSFVAPSVLSPDSDLVLSNKLRFSELMVERARAAAELESVNADLAAAKSALERLQKLQQSTGNSLGWTTRLTSDKASTGAAELELLEEQKRTLTAMHARQAELTQKAQADLQSGLISRGEYGREAQALTQVELALLENERSILQGKASQRETLLAKQALERRGEAPPPELMAREEQLVRVELELLRLQSEVRSRRAQGEALTQRIATIDELALQLRSRPIFQATERSMEVAFVPYTQIEGVAPGARVLECVWGLFLCEDVGTVGELVPGEVILPDPWGTQARGQYAVLKLTDHEAAQSKILRVRPASGGPEQPEFRQATAALEAR
jgi:hypothetical protein